MKSLSSLARERVSLVSFRRRVVFLVIVTTFLWGVHEGPLFVETSSIRATRERNRLRIFTYASADDINTTRWRPRNSLRE